MYAIIESVKSFWVNGFFAGFPKRLMCLLKKWNVAE